MAGTAEARDRHGDRDNSDEIAIAIGAGLVGLAIGAAIADRDDRHYYDRSRYSHRRYVRVRGYPGNYYYYDGYPNRYYRDRYYDRYYGRRYRDDYRRDRWRDGYRRVERWYGRDRRDSRDDHRRGGWRD